MGLKILDCALRDGGYYNNWDFDAALVDRYLHAMEEACVDVVELGFRYGQKQGFFGPYAYLSERILAELDVGKYNFEVAVMIEESDLSPVEDQIDSFISNQFVSKSQSSVDIVRIAVHFERAELVIPAVKQLHDHGYKVIVNLMQISRVPLKNVESLLRNFSTCIELYAVYFADSLGSMSPDEVRCLCDIFKRSWGRPFGFHAHNNCGRAVENSLVAADHGCELIDCTVTGMGRGAGNALTEMFLLKSGLRKVHEIPALITLALDDFTPMRRQYGWGESLTYYIAAQGQVHPTYVQTLEAQRTDLRSSEIATVIGRLSGDTASSFNSSRLSEAMLRYGKSDNLAENVPRNFENQKVLILGPGDSLEKHSQVVRRFIAHDGRIVISCSVSIDLNSWPIDYFICSSSRALSFVDRESSECYTSVFITPNPISDFEERDAKYQQFPLLFSEDELKVDSRMCRLGTHKSLIYALAYCYAAGANEVLIAGFDGYGEDDPRTIEMSYWLSRMKSDLGLNVTSILPTVYPINTESVYSHYV